MRKIEVFLPLSIDNEAVSESLLDAGAFSVSITAMRVFNRDQKRVGNYRGARYAAQFVQQLKVEIVVEPVAMQPVMTVMQGILKENDQVAKQVRVFISELEELGGVDTKTQNAGAVQ
ncbi:P-II family nitrogen regulator [Desulfogranum japonicum]|uniref:P-II family nitrogen regulator n=1 Tax=Desulfogranum japonicum TaxID=231447 RepID=UPI0003F7032A|nr:P-II family nitrogen regulator [Desulfogranum japonicum]